MGRAEPKAKPPEVIPVVVEPVEERLDAETEAKIEAKFQAFMRIWTKQGIAPENLDAVTKEQRRLARLFYTDQKTYGDEVKLMIDRMMPKTAKQPLVSPAVVQAYLEKQAGNLTPWDYVLAGQISKDPGILAEALSRDPDNADLLFSQLLLGGKYLTDRDGVEKLVRLDGDSPWPAILGAIAAMKSNEPTAAARFLGQALEHEISPYEDNYKTAWEKMRSGLSENENAANALPRNVESVFGKKSWELYGDIIYGAAELVRQHPGDAETLNLAGKALALAERDSESGSLTAERVGLMNQLDLLTAMGAPGAQPYLAVPYQELVASLHGRRDMLQQQIEEVKSFTDGLKGSTRSEFENLVQSKGEWNAYLEMRNQ